MAHADAACSQENSILEINHEYVSLLYFTQVGSPLANADAAYSQETVLRKLTLNMCYYSALHK